MKIAPMKRITDLWVVIFLWILHLSTTSGQFDANFTLQNVWGRLQENSRSIIQCLSDDSHKKIKFSRKLDTGQGSRLPRLSQQFMQGKPVFARILFMPGEDMLNRFGAFQCKIITNNVATEIVTLKLPPSNLAELDAVSPYNVVSVGENLELEVNVLKEQTLPVKWRHDGVDVPDWDDQLKVEIHNAQLSDAGIYECYYEGRRSESLHALVRVIVRDCPPHLYGKDCDQDCPPCYNGGICHDKWGVCVCPAGFSGLNCETACGGNHFGANCSKTCSPPQVNSQTDELCASHLFCKPDPYGCTCAPGFKGSSCMQHCEPGWYGADCKQPCHCAYGMSSCNRITGACDGGCAKGWRGDACQIEDPNANSVETTTMAYCPLGSYGSSCEKKCHCSGNEHCTVKEGHCPSGCADGWGGSSCDACVTGKFGDNCEFNCHCEGGHHECDDEGHCLTGCKAGWAGVRCQTECTPGRFGPNCAKTCHCHKNSTSPCDKITGVCEGDCEPGYMGDDCQTLCPHNRYGVNCLYSCTCLNGGHCNRIDGSCACEGRWKAQTCNESEPQIVAATDEEVNVGQQVYISCTADAVPEPIMNISSGDHPGLKVITRTPDTNQYQAFVKMKPAEAGKFEFMCTARNDHGFDMKKIILTVIASPRLTTPPWLLDSTNHSLTVGWKDWEYGKDEGGTAADKIEYMVVYREPGAKNWENVEDWSTEMSNTVYDLTPNTQYEVAVKCRRFTKGGEGEVSPGLSVRTKCGVATEDAIPQELLPDVISQTAVSMTWKKPYDEPLRCELSGYYLTYHPEADDTILQDLELDADANTARLEDLSPNTNYVIRLYAVTAVGRSKYPAELPVRTYEAVPEPVSHLECRAVDDQPQLLLVSWEAPSDVNGVIKGYVITYTLTDKGHCGQLNDSEDTRMRKIQSNDTEITLQNLHPYSKYNVSVQALTSAGESDPVSELAETAEAAPDESPPNVRLLSSTSHSLEFRWDPIPCDYANGFITHYEYMMVERGNLYPIHLLKKKRSLDVPVPNSSLNVVEGLQVEVKNLQPDTEYGFMVKGVVARNFGGPLSDIIFQKTDEDLPSPPQYLETIKATSREIGLSWYKPNVTNGKIIQYRIQFWDHEHSVMAADVLHNVTDDDEDKVTALVKGLPPATDFFIQVRAATGAGWGEYCSPISGRTLDGEPGEPSEVAVLQNSQTTMNITWKEPIKKGGVVTGYKISHRPVMTLDPVFNSTNFTQEEVEVGAGVREITLTGLHPSTEYAISVAARTSAGYGPDASIGSWTVIRGEHVSPSLRTLPEEATNGTIPIAFSTTGSTAVYKYQVIVEDSRNKHPIDESKLSDYDTAVVEGELPYYIAAELDPTNVTSDGEQSFVVGDGQMWGRYKNVHLNPAYTYNIRIRTLVYKESEIKSVLSVPKQQTTAPAVLTVDKSDDPKIAGLDMLVFILILIALLVFVTAVSFLTALAICKRRNRKKSSNSFCYRDAGLSESMTWSVMYKSPGNETVDGPLICEGYKTYPLSEKHTSLKRTKSDSKIARGLRIEALEDFFMNAMATNQLEEEFKRLVEGQTSPWTVARKSANLKKNRYGNILPYDRCRVVLHSENNKNDSDYINASYIDGYRRPREYIITQGPLENTIEDFWRMVWQENSPVIVMITDLVENGKKKCAKYWPDDSMMCGDIQILLIHSEECTDYVIRTLLMRKMDEVRTHRVLQYQYTAWPDRTVPLNTNYFIKFLKRARNEHPVMGGPMIVHCSAGAGRSGTYVAIDALCQQAAEDRRVEVFRFVSNARHQRIHLVQTLEQYTFIYEALVELVQFEDTSIPLDKIGMYLKELSHMSTLDQRALIIKQYNKLNRTQKKVDANRCSVALSEDNIFKNRDPLTVPMDVARVRLTSEDQMEDTLDYINAVFVDGCRKKSVYLATQMPLTHTIVDFWRMIYHHKSSLIVMLNTSDETDRMDVGIYWPETGDNSYGEFTVQVITFEEQGDFITRIMRLTHSEKKNEEPMKVIQLQYNGWTSEMKPASMLRLQQNAELWYQRSEGGPITVHCMDGATRSGLFIASRNVSEQINEEGILDVYQVVKSMRINRPEFIPNSDQFRFLFEVAQEVAEPILSHWEETLPVKKLSFKI